MRKFIFYMAVLIGLYLVAVHWGGFANELKASFKGASELTTALQGR